MKNKKIDKVINAHDKVRTALQSLFRTVEVKDAREQKLLDHAWCTMSLSLTNVLMILMKEASGFKEKDHDG